MRTIKEILDSLPAENKRLLMYAFEHGLSQYVELPDNRYIGVNSNGVKHLFIEQAAGAWSTGINAAPKKENKNVK